MKIRIARSLFFVITSAFFVLTVFVTVPAMAQDGGRLCKSYPVTTGELRNRWGQCTPPRYVDEHGHCLLVQSVDNSFTYRINEDDSLDFALFYTFNGGHSCAITGTAQQTQQGWRYSENPNHPEERKRCVLNIVIAYEHMFFDALDTASCRQYCGAHAILDNTVLPMASLEKGEIMPEMLDPGTYVGIPCRDE